MAELANGLYGNGSFGIRAKLRENGRRRDGRPDGALIRIWFCGGYRTADRVGLRVVPADSLSLGSICVHSTREEARECRRAQREEEANMASYPGKECCKD